MDTNKNHLFKIDNYVYKVRSDIVLEQINGKNVLVAKRSARGICPAIIVINESAAFFWEAIQIEGDFNSIYRKMAERYHMDSFAKEDIYNDLILLLEQLCKKHYIEKIS